MFYKFDIYDGVINDGSVTNGVIKDAYIANGNFNGSYVVNGTSGTVISGVYVGDAPIVNIGSMHQGYLIDNFTGYVYSCDAKLEFKNGFVVKEGKYYDFAIDSDGKLSLDLVVRNESLHIYNIFKDKYGNKYVQNDYLDAYDADNKTVYYTKTNYFLARDGTAIHIDYTGQFNYSEIPSSFTVLERMNADFTASAISDAESYEIDFSPCNGNSSHDESNVVISHIADGYLYMYSTQGGAYTYYLRVRTDDFKSESRSYGMYSYDGGNWTYNCLKSAPIDAVPCFGGRIGAVRPHSITETYGVITQCPIQEKWTVRLLLKTRTCFFKTVSVCPIGSLISKVSNSLTRPLKRRYFI